MAINTKKILDFFHKDLNYEGYKIYFETERPVSLQKAKEIQEDYTKKNLKQPSLEEIISVSQRFYFKALDDVEEVVKKQGLGKKSYVLMGDRILEHFNKCTNSYSKSLNLIFDSFSLENRGKFYPLLPLEMTRRFQSLYSEKETENGGYDKMLHYLFSQYLTDKLGPLCLLVPLEKVFSISEEPVTHILMDISADFRGMFKYYHVVLGREKYLKPNLSYGIHTNQWWC